VSKTAGKPCWASLCGLEGRVMVGSFGSRSPLPKFREKKGRKEEKRGRKERGEGARERKEKKEREITKNHE
jgi:hypothetical protein